MGDVREFSSRRFLWEHRALLVHFSTGMSRHAFRFPEDLRNAIGLRDIPLSCSTIIASDVGPYSRPDMHPADANSGGSVGLVVDFDDERSVLSVGPSDDGTYFNDRTKEWISGGSTPSREACERSLSDRTTSNEWFVRNYKVIGIFVYFPIVVMGSIQLTMPPLSIPETIVGERQVSLKEVLESFPAQRVFSAESGEFREYDRTAGEWRAVEFATIMPER